MRLLSELMHLFPRDSPIERGEIAGEECPTEQPCLAMSNVVEVVVHLVGQRASGLVDDLDGLTAKDRLGRLDCDVSVRGTLDSQDIAMDFAFWRLSLNGNRGREKEFEGVALLPDRRLVCERDIEPVGVKIAGA